MTSFKEFYDTEVITIKYPCSAGKMEMKLSLKEYTEYINKSLLPKKSRKDILSNVAGRREIPVFCENKFYMLNLINQKCREIKSRDDKISCGVLYNGMLRESKNSNVELYEQIKDYKLPWEAPPEVYIT